MSEQVVQAPTQPKLSRRRLFLRSAWSTFALLTASSLAATVRFFFPRVVFEPSPRFKAGAPEEFPPGTVNTEFAEKYRVWIVRKESGELLALKAECTHLGCTPRWLDSQRKFKCPCHGSGFRPNGVNFEGPAPRPLDRVRVTLAADGKLEIDRSVVFRGLAGEDSDELYPQSILRL